MEYPGTKHCGSCKHFEPSTEWRRGWCRNTLLFAPSQSHLVDSEGLDCSRGALDFWEPIPEAVANSEQNAGQQHVKMPNFHNPLKSFAPAPAGPAFAAAGASGGHMMFASSGSGGGGYDDDDYGYDDDFGYESEPEPEPNQPANRRRPSRAKPQSSAAGGRTRSASYQSEERYWTDYLRIALPVIGIVLMLGLLWIWASHLLGGSSDDTDIKATDTVGLVTTTTPDTSLVSTPDTNTNAGEIPIGNTTTQPTQPPTDLTPTNTPPAGDNQAGNGGDTQTEETPEPPTEIAPDAWVVVTEDGVNMRQTPSTTGEVIRQVDKDELFQIRSGPEQADDYTWWEVVDDDGESGWIVENFLELTE